MGWNLLIPGQTGQDDVVRTVAKGREVIDFESHNQRRNKRERRVVNF